MIKTIVAISFALVSTTATADKISQYYKDMSVAAAYAERCSSFLQTYGFDKFKSNDCAEFRKIRKHMTDTYDAKFIRKHGSSWEKSRMEDIQNFKKYNAEISALTKDYWNAN